jgi:hypothetical protein
MIGWHDLVGIKRIKELALSAVLPTLMRRCRRCPSQTHRRHRS